MDLQGPALRNCRWRKDLFTEKHFKIIDHCEYDGSWVLFRATTPVIVFDVLVAHAPHLESDPPARSKWWKHLSERLFRRPRYIKLLTLIDANARIGICASRHIGDLDPENPNNNTESFVRFVDKHRIFLPSTFTDIHCNDS